jgi:hypothetical protein
MELFRLIKEKKYQKGEDAFAVHEKPVY